MKQSAGILVYRRASGGLEVFLVHPGGPFWANKEEAAWSVPKGEFSPGEDPLAAARREFEEETGQAIDGDFLPLAPCRQAGGKTVFAWAVEGQVDPATVVSNDFVIEWPRRSGRLQRFPEVDRGAWFALDEARRNIHRGQAPILDELARRLTAP
jgi:predicted NUDIX family NTP pyrophosphohydrolase